ncbi:AMP-binding enzyme family protein [Histomonas meleagridis]|uniref:AMP-binding enzyme family protein n=1 Tax=Histomonas meleagridis TaxID=135588 RepID=UPI00355A62F9|nr:AMP-binding enzyme family protein [Histomonas meleagridis]KAH0805511.1 AMP-binding enzyme family protein [Histomonas meleagridis]
MGSSQSAPPGTYSSNATTEVTPYTIRRHPKYADGVLQLPKEYPNGQAIYLKSMEKYKENDYVGNRKIENGVRADNFTYIKYKEAFEISNNFASGLSKLGIKSKDYVALYSENRPEWILASDSSYILGFTVIHLYDTFALDALEFSIVNCGTHSIILSKKNMKKFHQLNDKVLQQFHNIILFDEITADEIPFKTKVESFGIKFMTFDEVCKLGSDARIPPADIDPEQIMYVCYSSGTTGFPKGVMISNRSFVTNLIAIHSEGTNATFERHLSYLPLCHVFEKMCSSCVLFSGGKIGIFSGEVALLAKDMSILKPTVFCVVPRVLQRIHESINTQIKSSSIIVRGIYNTMYYLKSFLLNYDLPTFIPDFIVFNRIKNILGGSIEQIVNGAAALPINVHKDMQVIFGIPIRTGYGLSEGGSGNTLSPFKLQHIKFGTNGYPLANVEIRIEPVEDFDEYGTGEIQMGGTGLCSGYLNDIEGTNNLFVDKDHTWIHTGDIGKFDEDNALIIVDRMRSIFKLSQGEYVAGDLLATFFEASPLIQNIFVYGDSTRQYLVAIVIPNKKEVELFFNKKFDDSEFDEICKSVELNQEIMKQIDDISVEKKLLGYQKIKKILCVNDQWNVDNGCMSPTFKLKRKVLAERYKDEINELYK